MRVERFLHAKLDVRDLAAAERFYRDLLGLREIVRYEIPGGCIVQYSPTGEPPGVELWYEADRVPAPPNESHIALEVDDTRAWTAQLRGLGVEVATEPFEVGHELISFVRDPDGHLVELNQPHRR